MAETIKSESIDSEKYSSEENSEDYRSRWRSIRVIYLSIFFNSLIFSLILSSIWPFLKKFDTNVKATYIGWIHGGYNIATCISSLIFGLWMDKRKAKEPLYCSLTLFFIGFIIYAWAEAFEKINFGKEAILISRIIAGLSAGNVAILRASLAQSTTLEERTPAMAHFTAYQAFGFAIGPALQLIGIPIGDKGVQWDYLKLTLNVYTYPGFLGSLMAIINTIAVFLYFKPRNINVYTGADEAQRKYQKQLEEGNATAEKADSISIATYMVLHFVNFATFSIIEAILVTLSMDEFAWTKQEGILYGGIIFSTSGVLVILFLVVLRRLTKGTWERMVLLLAFILMAIGFFIILPWGNEYPKLAIKPRNNSTTTSEITGCPEDYKWCTTTPKIYLPQLITGYTIIILGFTAAVVMIASLYSKAIKPGRQGFMMAWLATVAGLSRGIGPTVTTFAYVAFGPRWTFLGIVILQSLAAILVVCRYKTFVPYHVYILRGNKKQVFVDREISLVIPNEQLIITK